jgi:hypothetical protein
MSDEVFPPTTGKAKGGIARAERLSPEERREISRKAALTRWSKAPDESGLSDSEILIYQTDDNATRIDVRLEDGTVWLTQLQMAQLFQTTRPNITQHVRNVYFEGELDIVATSKNSLLVQNENGREVQRTVELYNLDVIISVGYRVKSQRGTQFRIWATQKLREYIVKGFSLDDQRLKNSGTRDDYFDELLKRVREIRTSEKNFWRKITDVYATSIDYDRNSPITQRFFATVQNKFHYAIHHHTAPELIAERANADLPNMGLTSWAGERIRKSDTTVAKNYLTQEEIEQLNLLVDQYLSFAELQARQRKPMHMVEWVKKLDDFLRLNDRDILGSAGRVSKALCTQIAEREFDKYWMKQKALESPSSMSDFDKYVRRLESERETPKKD